MAARKYGDLYVRSNHVYELTDVGKKVGQRKFMALAADGFYPDGQHKLVHLWQYYLLQRLGRMFANF